MLSAWRPATRGTVYFDDFESRRFSYIGTLTDPGVNDPQATNAAGWFTRTYQYSASIPHAVTNVTPETGSPDTYSYDANGNMTCRVEAGVTFIQTYNAENRIATIQKLASGTCAAPGNLTAHWAFAYDGDGTRVSTLYTPYVSGAPQTSVLTAYYMGGAYEVTGSAVKKYYSIAGMMIAVNDGTGLQYLLTDHLGSTVAVTNASGTLTSQQRYLPFGAPRTITNSPIIGTDFTYTGQRKLDDGMGGIMDYRARFYSPYINRFLQPDSIISNPANPQVFNRYSYVLNNPLKYIDPTGHVSCEGKNKDDGPQCVYFKNGGPKTLDDFKKLSWQQRRDWLDIFTEKNKLGNWFDDIKNAISGFMAHDPVLNDASGATYYMDAAVLQEINNGWNMYEHGSGAVVGGDLAIKGASSWANFFNAKARCNATGCNEDSLVSLRLQGEDDGVNIYAWPMTIQSGVYAQDDSLGQHVLSAFLDVANTYRYFGISHGESCGSGVYGGWCDPRTAGPKLAGAAQWAQSYNLFDLYYWQVIVPNKTMFP